MSTPNGTNRTGGPASPSHSRRASASPHPYVTIVLRRRYASRNIRRARAGAKLCQPLGKPDRRVDDRSANQPSAGEQRERNPDGVHGREHDICVIQLPTACKHGREVPRIAANGTYGSVEDGTGRTSSSARRTARSEVVRDRESGRCELVQAVQAVSRARADGCRESITAEARLAVEDEHPLRLGRDGRVHVG